jgi:hypothetical protein
VETFGIVEKVVRSREQRLQEEAEARRQAQARVESSALHRKQRERDLAEQWLEHHQRLLDAHKHTHTILTAHHRQEIAKYERLLGVDPGPRLHDGN